jgi:hypothetical protein
MNFIILGDKYQKGMKSKGCVGLIKINKNDNLFENQYRTIKEFDPSANIIYVYGFESKKFINFINKHSYALELLYNDKYETNNQTFSLSLAKNFLNNDCFIIFGDNILKKTMFNKFNTKLGSQIFISSGLDSNIGCIIHNNAIENISFDLDNKLTNIYYVNQVTASRISDLISDQKYHNSFIFEIINKIIDTGTIFKPYFMNKKSNFQKVNYDTNK